MSFHAQHHEPTATATLRLPPGDFPPAAWLEFAKIRLFEPEPRLLNEWLASLAEIVRQANHQAPERRAVTPTDNAARTAALRHWFGIQAHRNTRSGSASPVAVLTQLYDHAQPLTARQLAVMLSSTPNAIHVAISCLRSMMDSETIDLDVGRGYSLTQAGREEYRTAVRAMAESLTREAEGEPFALGKGWPDGVG